MAQLDQFHPFKQKRLQYFTKPLDSVLHNMCAMKMVKDGFTKDM